MDRSEFIETATRKAYCKAETALLYVEMYPKDEYNRFDLIEAYRLESKPPKYRDGDWEPLGNGNYKRKKHIEDDS
jgi:hypothetical protein